MRDTLVVKTPPKRGRKHRSLDKPHSTRNQFTAGQLWLTQQQSPEIIHARTHASGDGPAARMHKMKG